MCESVFCSSLDCWRRKDQIQHRWMKRVYLMNKEWISAAWHIRSDGKGSKCECFLVVGTKSFETVITWRSLWRFSEVSLMIPDAGQPNQPSFPGLSPPQYCSGGSWAHAPFGGPLGGSRRWDSRALLQPLSPCASQCCSRREGGGLVLASACSRLQFPACSLQGACSSIAAMHSALWSHPDWREISAAGSDTGFPPLG